MATWVIVGMSIYEAIEASDIDSISEILETECNLSSRNEDGKTALDVAAILGKKDVIELLTKKDIDINATNDSGIYIWYHTKH